MPVAKEKENPYLIKHLEFIQLTLVRMAANSFLVKGWTVTFVAAILAFTIKDKPRDACLVALVPCLLFWYLDGFFLAQERLFRCLYDAVRTNPMRPLAQVDFSLDTTPFKPSGNFLERLKSRKNGVRCMLSRTVGIFFLILVIIVVLVWFYGRVDPSLASKVDSTSQTASKEQIVMARRTFFSFHFERDSWRAGQVRNSWVTHDRQSAGFWDSAEWEKVKLKGEAAVHAWIDEQLKGTSVTVVLIGAETSKRDYVGYEVKQSHMVKNGMIGVYIHNMKDSNGNTDTKGANPFDNWEITQNGQKVPFSKLYKTYDWVSDNGYSNLGTWIEEAAKAVGR